jgi:phytoene dehydrogenase-like protein
VNGAASDGKYDAVVIGAGHNGLVAAAYLARGGLRTLVLERSDRVGGAATTTEIEPGVRIPAVAHTVGGLRPSIVRDLHLRDHGLEPIAPQARVFAPQPDGESLTLWGDAERTARELAKRSPAEADAFTKFDSMVRSLASFMAYVNVTTPPDLKSPGLRGAFTGARLARAFRALGKRGGRELLRVLPMAVADFVGEAFESDALRAAVAFRGVRYTAMGPWSAGTTAVLLSDSTAPGSGAAGQATLARGGPGALANALASSAQAFGAEIRTSAAVASVTSKNGRVTGVALADGREITAAVVISGADPKRTLLGLVDPEALGPWLVWRSGNVRLPGTVSKVNLVLSGVPRFGAGDTGADVAHDERLRGRIVMAPGIDALERAFDASKYGRMSDEPVLEATLPTLVDPTLAPEGIHVMSVLVQYTPYRLREGTWDGEREGLGDLVLKTLEIYAPGISSLVTARHVLTPVDLEREYGLTEGHPLHGELALDQFFAWRPMLGYARYRMPLHGLYLCGAGAHPGGGITGEPGSNAAREILADWKSRRP